MAHRTPPSDPSPAPHRTGRAGRREWTAFAVLMLPLLLVNMDVSVLYFAVPALNADLAPSSTQQLWILDVYAFMLAGLLITMGSLGDRIGPRRLLLWGAVAFGAASVLAAYASSAEQLILARALLGLGGATLMPSTLSLIRRIFTDARQRAIAIAIWSSVMAGGVALGSVLGGLLLEFFWWGSVFLINVPAMVLLLVLTPLLVPEFRPADRTGRFDLLSVPLSLGAVLPVIYAVKEIATGDADATVLLTLPAGLLLLALFVHRQRTSSHPMIDPALFRNRGLAPALLLNALGPFALLGASFFTSQYLQMVLGKAPLEAALWSLVPTAGVAAAGPLAVQVADRRGRRAALALGFATAATGWAVLVPLDTGALAHVLVGAGVLAFGVVMVLSQVVDLALGITPEDRAGSVSALSETSAEFGGAVGMAVFGSIGTALYRSEMDQHTATGGALADLPSPVADTARETLGAAAHLAGQLPADQGGALLNAARDAFVRGMNAAALLGVVALLGAAALAWFTLRRVPAAHRGARPPTPGPSSDSAPDGPPGPRAGDAGLPGAAAPAGGGGDARRVP